ncbi:hypothetical protein [Leptolyngbya sp. NIES-2104]|uniref:hypothetical protein n=1 Tax=Leptolyngbya sp. NIES-2104 TaxID=1552121 RepID=UPI0006EC7579|nr:hypothetical protein [Leptolyngbya sp. NIES-2104]GAP97458.1 hypothetical protein NIES2104_40050 [Leptolyngbya sp. NIES-2104]
MTNISPEHSFQPLSVGNVVSAGVRLYRSNMKRYLILVLRSYLWSFVPIYGWGKSIEITGRMSRLAYQELINQPETMTEAYQKTDRQIWNFLVSGLLMGLINFGLFMAFFIGYFIFTLLTVLVLSALGSASPSDTVGIVVSVLIGLGFLAYILVAFFIWLRVFSRLFIHEVPLAIEEGIDGVTTIGRSWTLTKGSVGRIQLIILVAGLITLVIMLPAMFFVLGIIGAGADPENNPVSGLFVILFYAAILLGNALIIPFWQAIKAVVYYDLRSRREGLGLELRDRG